MNKKVQFSCDVEFVSTFANEDYGKKKLKKKKNIIKKKKTKNCMLKL